MGSFIRLPLPFFPLVLPPLSPFEHGSPPPPLNRRPACPESGMVYSHWESSRDVLSCSLTEAPF